MTDNDMLDTVVMLTERSVNRVNPQLREDLVQTGYESGLKALKTYDPDRGNTTLRNWLIRHVRRSMIRYLISENRHGGHVDIQDVVDCDDTDILTDYDSPLKLEQRLDLLRSARQLTDIERQVINLHTFQDLSYRQTAKKLSLTKQATYRLFRGAVNKLIQK